MLWVDVSDPTTNNPAANDGIVDMLFWSLEPRAEGRTSTGRDKTATESDIRSTSGGSFLTSAKALSE